MRAGGEEETEMKRVEINGELGEIIPFDVFAAEILPRLPAEELQKLKIVCRDWLKLLWSPGFARVHLEWGIRPIRVLMPFESAIVECNSGEETKRIPYPPHVSSSKRIIIMGSCDGLLCLLIASDRKIAVFNPSTGKYFGMQIAESQGTYISCYWFGRVAGKYLLVLGYGLPYKLEVYNFISGSDLQLIQSVHFDWHLPHPTFFNCSTYRGLFFRGAVHWPARMVDDGVNDDRNDGLWGAIIAFHLEQNKWFKILLPPRFRRSGFKDGYTLGLADECLL